MQIVNVTLSGGTSRNLGTLPVEVRPTQTVFGVIEVQGASGYVQVATSGGVSCYSAKSGNFSGQVVLL